MDKYIPKKLLGCMNCGLLIVAGSVGNMAYGSQGAAAPRQLTPWQVKGAISWAIAGEKIPNDPYGDTWYLQAVRSGNLEAVRCYLSNSHLNLNETDNDRNTDLMLAIRGGEQDEWRPEYREIFNLIVQRRNRNWNLQNKTKKQTALLLAVGWGRLEALDALLQIDEIDPNIPNIDNTTPLIAAINNYLVSPEVREAMIGKLLNNPQVDVNRPTLNNVTPLFAAIGNVNVSPYSRVSTALQLINHPRVNVNLRGTGGILPIQFAYVSGFAPQLSNAICRRSLVDYDMAVKNEAKTLMGLLVHGMNDQALFMIQHLLVDPRVNVNDYYHCPINQLVDAGCRKTHFLLNQLGIDISDLPRTSVDQLRKIDANIQLYNTFLTRQDSASFWRLCSELQ
ncbi:MAG: ankyrin repeat domain-containing protein [Puniceicoccales bacterium]|jgi:ankyrin repeat protein|nr:ankyrin repeat domain-containing protein [Puniceicoccales bacterium]